jgi:hypothetical protein
MGGTTQELLVLDQRSRPLCVLRQGREFGLSEADPKVKDNRLALNGA